MSRRSLAVNSMRAAPTQPVGIIRITATEFAVDTVLWPKLATLWAKYRISRSRSSATLVDALRYRG